MSGESDLDPPPAGFWERPLFPAGSIFLLALILRVGAAELVERHVQDAGRSFFVEGDANGYWELAHNIAAGRDYAIHQPPRRVLRVPGFPLLLAASIRLFGDSIHAARILLAGIGAACCVLTWMLGRQLVGSRTGTVAAAVMAVHPFQVAGSVLILSETWFTFWMLAGLLALARLTARSSSAGPADCRRTLMSAAAAGMLLAAAVLVRPGFLPWLLPAEVAVLMFLKGSWRIRLTAAGVLFLGFSAAMFPWALRNHQVTGHWVVTSLWSGPSLYDGLNPEADGSSDMTFFDRDNVMESLSEYEMNAHYQRRALEFLLQHPARAAWLAVAKARRFLQPVPATIGAGWAVQAVCAVIYGIFFWFCWRGWRFGGLGLSGVLITAGPFVLFLAVHMVFVGSLRYRLPAEFPLAVAAAAGIPRGSLRVWRNP